MRKIFTTPPIATLATIAGKGDLGELILTFWTLLQRVRRLPMTDVPRARIRAEVVAAYGRERRATGEGTGRPDGLRDLPYVCRTRQG